MVKSNLCCLLAIVFGLGATAFMISTIVVAVKLKDEQNNIDKLEETIDAMTKEAKTDAPAPTSPPTDFVNVCEGKKNDVKLANTNCSDVGVTPQSGANVTEGYVGGYDGVPMLGEGEPITSTLAEAGLCPVNVHWHLGAEHASNGQYDMNGMGPSKVAERRRLAGKVDPGGQCYLYDENNDIFTDEYVWEYCTDMEVGQTYEVHWPHSVHGACDTENQYQEPFYDGVFCHFAENGESGKYAGVALSQQIGVQAQVFVIVNDKENPDNFYQADLFKGMIVDASAGTGTDIAYYTGSTTGQSRNNTICSQYGPITWQVDRTCNKISASSFDNMCKTMKEQRDETLGSKDTHPHGSRVVVSDILADQQIPRRISHSEPQGFPDIAPVSFPESEPQGFSSMAPSTPYSNEIDEPTVLQFFFAGDMIQAEWNSDALRQSIFREYADESDDYNEGGYTSGQFNSIYDFTVNVEILAYDAKADANHSPFVKIQSFNQSSADSDTTTFVLDDATVSPFMIPWGSNGNMVAVILIRVVAYSTQFWNEDNPNAPWILATRTSKLVGVLPRSMEENTGECPILYNQDCDSIDDPNPCPPSHAIALEDLNFSPDNSCRWPSGNNSCDPSPIDPSPICSYYSEFDGCEFNENMLGETDGCPCASSHPGAAGCVNDNDGLIDNDGVTQCCYTEAGALITEYDDGAGRPKCVQSGVISIDSVDTFLFDTLPYLLCCGLNELDDRCESYYNAFPDSFLEGDYENPTTAAVSFGDPHLVTFDRVNYNFNGFGEYVAVCGGPATLDEDAVRILCSTSRRRLKEDDERTSIHFRFRPFLLETDQMATINAGIAIQDPSFNEGTKRLTVILDRLERLVVYEGDTPIDNFTGRGRFVRYRSPGGLIISKPRDTNRTTRRNFVMVIRFTSGLRVKISESEGAMNPTITRPKGNNNYVGLMGQGDGNSKNEFITRNGASINITIRSDITEGDFTAFDDKEIFNSFGTEWVIENSADSLFSDISTVPLQGFNEFDQSREFEPTFDSFFDPDRKVRQLRGPPAEEICAEYENTFIRQACIFDFGITGNEALVRSTSDFAEEEKEIRTLLLNTPPGVRDGGRSQNITVGVSIDAVFKIESFDTDGDNVTARITRNDGTLFELSDKESAPGTFEVQFLGSGVVGNFKAHVTLTDDITPVLVTMTVVVVRTAPPTNYPSNPPSSSPTISPTAPPTHYPSSSPSKSLKSSKKSSKRSKKSSKGSKKSSKSKS